MSARLGGALGLVMLGALLAGCASTALAPAAPAPAMSTEPAPTQLCALDALRWSHEFVPRATPQECVTILDWVKIGN